jgi:hypothetical protein
VVLADPAQNTRAQLLALALEKAARRHPNGSAG